MNDMNNTNLDTQLEKFFVNAAYVFVAAPTMALITIIASYI